MRISLGAKLKNLRFSCLILTGVVVASLFISTVLPILDGSAPTAKAFEPEATQKAIEAATFTVNGDALTYSPGGASKYIGSSFKRIGSSGNGDAIYWVSNQKKGKCPLSVVQLISSGPYAFVYVMEEINLNNREAGGDPPQGLGIDGSCVALSYSAKVAPITKFPSVDPNQDNNAPPQNNNNAGPGGTDEQGNDEKLKGCENDGGKLSFLLCNLVEQFFDVLNGVHEQAVKYLYFTLIAPDDKFGLNAEQYKQVKGSWLFISRLADVWLAIAFILMIIGTAVTNFMDAYSVKRILPRLIIAIIAVNLSWYICTFALEVGNVIGSGIRDIILSPFGTKTALVNLAIPGGGTVDVIGMVAGGIGFAALFAVPGLGGFILMTLMSIVMPVVMTIILGFMLIVARQGLLMLLIIVSPLAFSLWVLPGTENIFRRWQKLFSTLIIFYPIFQAILAIGTVVAIVISSKG